MTPADDGGRLRGTPARWIPDPGRRTLIPAERRRGRRCSSAAPASTGPSRCSASRAARSPRCTSSAGSASLIGGGLLFVGRHGRALVRGAVAVPGRPRAPRGGARVAATGSQAIERGRRTDLAYRGPGAGARLPRRRRAHAPRPDRRAGAAVGAGPRRHARRSRPRSTSRSRRSCTSRSSGCSSSGTGALSWRRWASCGPGAGAVRDLLLGAVAGGARARRSRWCSAALLSRSSQPAPSPLPDPGRRRGVGAQPRVRRDPRPHRRGAVLPGVRDHRLGALRRRAAPAIVRGAVFFALVHVADAVRRDVRGRGAAGAVRVRRAAAGRGCRSAGCS